MVQIQDVEGNWNPAWLCSDCRNPLIYVGSGWCCRLLHTGIIPDTLLAERLAKHGETIGYWVAEIARRKRKGK